MVSNASKDNFNRVCVIGLGYIGLPTAALIASKGTEVFGVDVNQKVVDTVNEGKIHIVEPDLNYYVESSVESEKLKCGIKPIKSDVFIIAVPTPFRETYLPDLTYVEAAAKSIASLVGAGNLVILESTSPIGTTELVKEIIEKEGGDTQNVYFAHCPERVLPGQIMKELVENDRIVGGIDSKSTKVAASFYRKFVYGEVLETTARAAEMTKLSENSFRDVNIAFANELSIIAEKNNVDVKEVIKLANHHPRVNILNPGVGVGGHCISVDPWFLISANIEEAKLMLAARETNIRKTDWVIEKIRSAVNSYKEETGQYPQVACLGLAYKPDIDDLRESPALHIAKELNALFDDLICVEPNIERYEGLNLATYEEAKDADIIAVLVPHKEFKDVNNLGKKVINYT